MGTVPVKTPCDGFTVTVELNVSAAAQPDPSVPVSKIATAPFAGTVTL